MLRVAMFPFSVLSLSLSAAMAGENQAIAVPDGADDAAIERIAVRGDFRHTDLQKLPGSVQVVTDAELKKQSAQHLDDVLQSISNLNFTAGASRGRFLQLRGIGERSEFVDSINPSVGVLVDGIDYAGIGLSTLSDLQQLEVFRGPEATRFGANALAGMLNFVSNSPVFAQEGKVAATLANYDSHHLELMLNQQLSEEVAVRFVADQQKSDGFIDNLFLQRDDTNNIDEQNYRFKLKYQPNAELAIDWQLNKHDVDNGYDAFSLNRNRTTLSDQPGSDRQDVVSSALKASFSGLASVDSQTQFSWLSAETDYGYDEDWAFEGMHPYGYSSTDRYLRDRTLWSLDQRFLSKANADAASSWVLGFYASDLQIDLTRQYTWFAQDFQSEFSRSNVAVYGDYQQQLDNKVQLAAGLRVERYQADYLGSNQFAKDADYWMWGGKLSVSYALSDLSQAYALVSKGYKVGGINGEAVEETQNPQLNNVREFLLARSTFKPEQLWNAEMGVKGQTADGTLQSRVTVFHMRRDDMQVKGWLNQGTKFVGYLDNAASGRNYGVELENRMAVTERFSLQVTGALLRTEMQDFVTKDGTDQSGRDQAQAPRWQFGLLAAQQLTEQLSVSLQAQRKAGYFYSDSEDIRAQAVTLLSARLEYQTDSWSLALWGRNLLDNEYGVQGFYFGNDPRDDYADHLYEQLGEPRRVGVSASYQF